MRGSRTLSGSPFARRIGINLAVFAGGYFKYFVAIAACLHHHVTAASVEAATFLGHKAAILSVFNGLTNHEI